MDEVVIRPAQPAELTPFYRLLSAAELPTEDLAAHPLQLVWIARQDAEVVGGIGVERYDDIGLLRSLVVIPSIRKRGVGERLVLEAERQSGAVGIRALYLLTTTAARFFERQGYRHSPRATAPVAIAQTQQFSGLCPSSSAFMSKSL